MPLGDILLALNLPLLISRPHIGCWKGTRGRGTETFLQF